MLVLERPVARSKVRVEVVQDLFHAPALMVVGDIQMKIPPDPLDAVVIGAIGWQEMKLNPAL